MEQESMKQGISTPKVIVITVVAAIIFGGGVYLYMNNKAEKEQKDLNAQIADLQKQVAIPGTTSATTTTDATASWKTYSSDTLGFSFKYPDSTNVSTNQDVSTTRTNIKINGTLDLNPEQIEIRVSNTQADLAPYEQTSYSEAKDSIVINGVNGTELTTIMGDNGNAKVTDIFLIKGSKIFHLQIDSNSQTSLDVLNKIVETFTIN